MFSCELVFNVDFGKCCMNLKVLIALSPHVPPIAYFKQRLKLLQSCESILYMESDNVTGNLHLVDIELGILEHKIPLMCPPTSAFGELMSRGARTKGGISHWDANACTLPNRHHFSRDFQDWELGMALPEQTGS